ncbi:cell division protein DivIC [Ereboglobus sp. PH5-5]|uniref:FtsB family cell division protein n=1 Tax=unclassified Ereboglobus TaxID=2626932 RepID=UPI002405412D|nr:MULTISPECIES: septum formation initiator family protein [unclassified Ereboglobus]MDF9827271.1 cell division protein DivIC [Ereboglobus sp. PH5-10]MDF9833748.1 cell division protein DivIC [Ereboglobus sp. PH5-5]
MKIPRINAFFLAIIATVMLVAAGYFGWRYVELRRQNAELQRNKDRLSTLFDEQKEKLRESQRILDRLSKDPEFVEMIIRRRLGYAKPGEVIYNFEEPAPGDPLPAPAPVENIPAPPPPQQQPQR